MNDYGWCPMLSDGGEYKSKCTKGECAWWDESKDDCIVFSLSRQVDKITSGGEWYDFEKKS